MMVFKVPFTDRGFVFQPFGALELGLANAVDRTADFLNNSALTRPVVRMFFPEAVSGSAVARQAVGEGIEGAREFAREYSFPVIGRLKKLMHENPEAVESRDAHLLIAGLVENGLTKSDELLDFERILANGPVYAKGQLRLKKLLNENPRFSELHKAAAGGDEEALAEFFERFPDIPLRADSDFFREDLQKFLAERGFSARPGVDYRFDNRQWQALSEGANQVAALQRNAPFSHAVPGIGAPSRGEWKIAEVATDGRVPIPDGGLTLHLEDGGSILSSEGAGEAVRLSPAARIFDAESMNSEVVSKAFHALTVTSDVPADRKLFHALGKALRGKEGALDEGRIFDLVEKLRGKTGSDLSASEVLDRLMRSERNGEVVGGLARHWHGYRFTEDGVPKIRVFEPEKMAEAVASSRELPEQILEGMHRKDLIAQAFKGRGSKEAAITMDVHGEATEMMIRRAQVEQELAAQTGGLGLEGHAAAAAKEELLGALGRVLEREDGVELLEQVRNVALGGSELMAMVAKQERLSGILNESTMPYFPRIMSKDVRKLINDHYTDTIKQQFGNAGLNFSNSFMKKRAFTDLTTGEVNYLARELGIKFTNRQSLRELSEQEAKLSVLAKIQERLIPKLKKEGSDEAMQVAELFDANPFTAWQVRIQRSQKAVTRAATVSNFVEEGSPLVAATSRLGDVQETIRVEQKAAARGVKLRPLIVTVKEGSQLSHAAGTSLDRIWSVGLSQERSASAMVAREALRDSMDQVLRDGTETIATLQRKLNDGARGLKPLETRLRELNPFNGNVKEVLSEDQRALLTVSDEDFWAVSAYKQQLKSMADLHDQLRDPALTKQAKQEVRATMDLAREKLEQHSNAMRSELEELEGIIDLYTGTKSAGQEVAKSKALLRDAKGALRRDVKAELKTRESQIRAWRSRRLEAKEVQDAITVAREQAKRGVLAMDELERLVPGSTEKLRKAMPDAQVHWMEDSVYEETMGEKGVLSRMFSAAHWQEFPNLLDRVSNIWKVWTALPFPQARVRDWVSNLALLMMGGTNPSRLIEAAGDAARLTRQHGKWLKGEVGDLGALQLKRVVDGAEEVLESRDLMHAAWRYGLLDKSFARDVLTEAGAEAITAGGGKSEHVAEFVRTIFQDVEKNPVIKTAAKVAGAFDNHAKLMGFIAEWKSGRSLRDAALHTRKWSYMGAQNLSQAEQTIRRFVPFYTWTRFAVEKAVSTYFQRPGALGVWEKLHRTANASKGLTPAEFEAAAPDFIRDNLGISVPWLDSDEGIKIAVLGSYVPLGDITRLVSAIEGQLDRSEQGRDKLLDYLGSTLAPHYKVGLEWARNRSFFTGRAIEQFPGDSDEMFGLQMPNHMRNLVKQVRFLNELDKLNIFNASDVKRMLSDPGNAVPRLREQGTLFERLGSGGFGVLPKLQTVDPVRETEFQARKKKTEASRTRSLLRKRLENKAIPGQEADVEALRDQLTELLAELKTAGEVNARFSQ